MPDPVQRLALSRTLWLIVAPPLVGLIALLAGRALRFQHAGLAGGSARRVGLASSLLAAAAVLGQAVHLAQTAPGMRTLVQRTPEVGVGPLAGGLGLAFDAPSAVACGLSCLVAVAAGLVAPSRSWRTWAWLDLALTGALLTFLADGFLTMFVGWTLSVAAAAWLAGWRDARAGAARATRGAAACAALLVGCTCIFWGLGARWEGDEYTLRPGLDLVAPAGVAGEGLQSASPVPSLSFAEIGARWEERGAPSGSSTVDATFAAFAAFAVAALAMSASPPPPSVPFALAAFGSGAAYGVVGPYSLLRMASVVPPSGAASWLIAAGGVLSLGLVARRALTNPSSADRLLALVGGAPAGVACLSVASDGVRGGWLVLAAAGSIAALLLLTAAVRGLPDAGAGVARRAPSLESAFLDRLPESAGDLLLSFERWVIDAAAGAVAVSIQAGGWVLARFDGRLRTPVDSLAAGTVRAGRALEPLVGGSLARVGWALLGALALGVLLHAVWP